MRFRDFGNDCTYLPGGQLDCGNPYGPPPTANQATPGGIVDRVLTIASDPGILLRSPPPQTQPNYTPFLWGGIAMLGLAVYLGRK